MHKLVIHKLGPIDHCSLVCSEFMTFTGFQASGKSTIAKAVFFFRTIKDDIYRIAEDKALGSNGSLDDTSLRYSLKKLLIDHLREKFLRIFGSSWGMDNDMYLEFFYSEDCFIRVSLKEETTYSTPNYIWIELSSHLTKFLNENQNAMSANALGIAEAQKQAFKTSLSSIFDDAYEIVYIPAGRSMLTLLSQQLSYIYTTMKDSQKRTLDYCTQDYIERILQLKSEFTNGLEGVAAYYGAKKPVNKERLALAFSLVRSILRGQYRYNDNEERIVLENNKYVKLNFASSGQQESVWILNLLFYYLVKATPVLFIIEEPESHLFPESQKFITEFISLLKNSGNSVLITTHSPYVLGTLNNLLYADQFSGKRKKDASVVIPENLWVDYDCFNAFFVKNGTIDRCIDEEIKLIQNERIDEISKVINQDFDRLFELQFE